MVLLCIVQVGDICVDGIQCMGRQLYTCSVWVNYASINVMPHYLSLMGIIWGG